MRNLEIEFKYNARTISPELFKEFCLGKEPDSVVYISGIDHFYSSDKDPNSFFRYRVGNDSAQLTFKRKLSNTDNVIRVEHNLDLYKANKKDIDAFCNDIGYQYNTGLHKISFIYQYSECTLSYYICYNVNMVETGRFIEIELDERIEWPSEAAAMSALEDIENKCSSLGISKLSRIKDSLFEMYRR